MQIYFTDHRWTYEQPPIKVDTQILGTIQEIDAIATFSKEIESLRERLEIILNAQEQTQV